MSAIAARIMTRSWGWGPKQRRLLAAVAIAASILILFNLCDDIDPRDR